MKNRKKKERNFPKFQCLIPLAFVPFSFAPNKMGNLFQELKTVHPMSMISEKNIVF